MGYLEERRKKKEQDALRNTEKNQMKRDEYLATLSNPDSNVDEFAKLIRWLLLPLFSLWVWYLGYIYTSNSLAGVVEPWQASVLSLLLPTAIQIIKIYAANKTLRAFHFKWYDRSGPELWFWSLSGILVGLMFLWSLKISVFDVKGAASDNFIASNKESLDIRLSADTKDIDAQIAAVNQSNTDASTMKTKRGKIAWSGQDIMMKNSTTLSDLMKQRKTIVEATTADYQQGKVDTQKKSVERGNFFQRFGGFGEFGEIIFCLLLGLSEAINRNNNLKRLENDPMPEKEPVKTGFQNLTQNGNGQSRSTSAYPQNHAIGFVWDGYGTTPINPKPPVSQPTPPVSQPTQQSATVLGCDKILMALRTKLQADIPNIIDKNGILTTIHKRIVKAFNECYDAMQHDDFVPSRTVAIKVYQYLADEAIPALNRVGWPYERDVFFLKRLSDVIEQRTPQEA